jgi:PAS domain S-box-containing protein
VHAPNARFKTILAYEQAGLLQNLLENIPDVIYFKDLQSRFILINEAAARFFKLKSSGEAIGKTDFDIFTKEHASAAFADEQEIIRTGIPLVGKEEKETWPDGTISWATTTKLPLRNSKGKIIGTFGISRNITERVRAMEQIAEQATLIDTAPDAIIVSDLQSRILFWNKGAEHVYGWSREEALGQIMVNLIFPKEFRAKYDEVHQAVLSEDTWKGELHHVSKDHRNLVIESHRVLVRDAEGQPKSVLIINTDVTEKKKIEAQFMRAQRMESIGVLAGGIAHDLNNILSPILMSIDLLKLTAKESQAKIIDTIEISTKRGAAIVKQMLFFARGVEGERTEIQLRHLLGEIDQITKDTFPKNIEVDISVAKNLWTIIGDPTQVHQALLNFCVNARDAMPHGGLLKVTVENRHLDKEDVLVNPQAKDGPYVILSVTDTGTGIEPEILEKIFDPFFTTKEVGKGTGLGLSTTMGIIKNHGGFITVYSEPGKGSTFHVYLPAKTSHEAEQHQTKTARLSCGKGETILIVDDESAILSMTSQALNTFGYKVRTAVNGAQAVAVYAEHRKEIAAVVTDMSMPVMDGLSTIHALKEINPDVKIIAASGLNDHNSMTRAAVAGVRHFLSKPCSTETLLKTLQEMLNEPQPTNAAAAQPTPTKRLSRA